MARVDIAFELIHGDIAGDSRSGGSRSGGSRSEGRRDRSCDSNHWLTLSRGNATSVDLSLNSFTESWLEVVDL